MPVSEGKALLLSGELHVTLSSAHSHLKQFNEHLDLEILCKQLIRGRLHICITFMLIFSKGIESNVVSCLIEEVVSPWLHKYMGHI